MIAKKTPLFSVLLPTRNRKSLLKTAIATVCKQDFDSWEIIISDNNSEENILDVVDSFNDDRIQYINTSKSVPVTENWQNALNHCVGDYVIMLGDDDGLLPGYFKKLSKLIERYESPDLIYTGALLYAYPNVMPGSPSGFLRSYEKREIYQNAASEFILNSKMAKFFVQQAMKFIVSFDFNMQFSLVGRNLLERLSTRGPFFQSPYPDYYASNVAMWTAETVLVVPQPLVTIGISPKSFGYYYFNNDEEAGNSFLANEKNGSDSLDLKSQVLPGSTMNDSWLLAMTAIANNFPEEPLLKPDMERYRILQVCAVLSDMTAGRPDAFGAFNSLRSKLTTSEWAKHVAPILSNLQKIDDNDISKKLALIAEKAGSHPPTLMPEISGHFSSVVDVYNHFT